MKGKVIKIPKQDPEINDSFDDRKGSKSGEEYNLKPATSSLQWKREYGYKDFDSGKSLYERIVENMFADKGISHMGM